jgi:hypothetical protein
MAEHTPHLRTSRAYPQILANLPPHILLSGSLGHCCRRRSEDAYFAPPVGVANDRICRVQDGSAIP